MAINSEAIRLLCKHGYIDDARILCRAKAKYNLWDCGTSSGWMEVYDVKIKIKEPEIEK